MLKMHSGSIFIICCASIVALALFALPARGGEEIPNRMVYQGTVYSISDSTAVSGVYPIAVAFFDDSLGGSSLWAEEFPEAAVTKGAFSLVLGGGVAIPDSLVDGRELWVETTFNGDVLLPRQRIHPVAYALLANEANHAVRADTALVAYAVPDHSHHSLDASDGIPADALHLDSVGRVGIGTTTPKSYLHVKFGSSGAPFYVGDGAIFESGANGWFAVYTPNTGVGGLMVSDPEDFDEARFYYDHKDNSWHLDGNGTKEMFRVSAEGNLGMGLSAPETLTARLDISATTGYNQLRLRFPYTPTGTADTNGRIGDVTWDNSYIYVRTADGWKRAVLTSF